MEPVAALTTLTRSQLNCADLLLPRRHFCLLYAADRTAVAIGQMHSAPPARDIRLVLRAVANQLAFLLRQPRLEVFAGFRGCADAGYKTAETLHFLIHLSTQP